MKKWLAALVTALVAVLLVLSSTPLKYAIHYNTYRIYPKTTISGNLTLNGNITPPESTDNGFIPLGRTGNDTLHIPVKGAFGIHLSDTYWAYYNSSINSVLNVVYVHLNRTGGKTYIAPGSLSHPSIGYRSKYQYTSQVAVNLPDNSNDSFNVFNPSIEISGSPSTWHSGVGYYENRSVTGMSTFYSTDVPQGKTLFSSGIQTGYFSLEPARMTLHTSAWDYFDFNFSHGENMNNASYVVFSMFSPSSNHVSLTVSASFVLMSGTALNQRFYILQQKSTVSLNLSGLRR